MAINIAETRKKIYENQPDKIVRVELEDGETHNWTVKSSGALLQLEMARFSTEIRKISTIKSEDLNEAQQQEVLTDYNSAVSRLESAFNTSVKSEDGSTSQFFKQNATDLPLLLGVFGDLIKEAKK